MGTCDFCLNKLANLMDSNRLPGVFITSESVTNMNNAMSILKNSIFSGHPNWDQEKLLDDKSRRQKILWHCPFKDCCSKITSLIPQRNCFDPWKSKPVDPEMKPCWPRRRNLTNPEMKPCLWLDGEDKCIINKQKLQAFGATCFLSSAIHTHVLY
jgi:hypothetical protein